MKAIAILATLLFFGCSSEEEKKCERYADMEIKCGDYPENEHEMTRKLSSGFCIEALGGDDMLGLKPEIDCAQKSKVCSEYMSCQTASQSQ